ncbi:MAG: hypothetical protein IV100_12045 [Myxococcales bacterium]|nr:hypothetical protein [Myxococcales bacterium]
MAQRTVFPLLPNIADAQYLGIVQSLFAELSRSGGAVPFKTFRDWAKERNLYNKEEFEDLLNFLGCDRTQPAPGDVVIGDFGKRFLGTETVEGQQKLLYRWLHAWNPILVKAVCEQLDAESGGRLHSTHELYRYITSYAYPGAYVTLPSFQNWIKWMAASGHIKYIGIRWGLGELGKKELPALKNFDVDEFLEDEADAAAGPALAGGASTAASTPTSSGSNVPAKAAGAREDELDEDLPDEPPSAPIPVDEDARSVEAAPERTAPAAATRAASPATAPVAPIQAAPSSSAPVHAAAGPASPAWFPAGPIVDPATAAEIGFTAVQYGESPAVFLFELAVAALFATSGIPSATWRPFALALRRERLLARYVSEDRPLEDVVEGATWLDTDAGFRALFGWVALDLMRLRRLLRLHPALPTRFEELRPAEALMLAHEKLFAGTPTGAAFWLHRQMVVLELWDA